MDKVYRLNRLKTVNKNTFLFYLILNLLFRDTNAGDIRARDSDVHGTEEQ